MYQVTGMTSSPLTWLLPSPLGQAF